MVREQGLELTGLYRRPKQLTKTVLEIPSLVEETTEHVCYEKHDRLALGRATSATAPAPKPR